MSTGVRIRGLELALLLTAAGLTVLGLASLRWAEGLDPWDVAAFWPAGLLLGTTLVIHAGLSFSSRQADELVLPLVAALTGLGFVLVQRLAGADFLTRQALSFAVGSLLLALLLFVPNILFILKRF